MKSRSDVIRISTLEQATTASWFATDDPAGCYALVFEDADGLAFASATKTYEEWATTFLELQLIHTKERQK